MDDTEFAENYGNGFIRLRPENPSHGAWFVRAASIISIQPVFKGDEWICCEVTCFDGHPRRVNASVEQIIAAMDAATAPEG